MAHKDKIKRMAKKVKRSSEYHLARDSRFGDHKVYDKATGTYGNFHKNKGVASYGLKYKNTDLEFSGSDRKPSASLKSLRRHKVKHTKPLALSHQK